MRKGRVQVLQLHGSLAPELQDRAIRGGGGNRTQGARRVILSTPIAESSVTIDGVRVVIDSGLRRSPAYDVQTGRVDGHPAVQEVGGGWQGNRAHGESGGMDNQRAVPPPTMHLLFLPGIAWLPTTEQTMNPMIHARTSIQV